jgi:hypothetical protein
MALEWDWTELGLESAAVAPWLWARVLREEWVSACEWRLEWVLREE